MPNGAIGYRPLMLVFIMMMASIGGIINTQSVSAAESGDLAITKGNSPIPQATYNAYYSQEFSINITNDGLALFTDSRDVRWYVCENSPSSSACVSNAISQGSANFNQLLEPGASAEIKFGDIFYPSGEDGTYTVVFKFHLEDSDSSNDLISYQFNLATQLVDVVIDESYDPLPESDDYPMRNGEIVYNTGKDLQIEAKAEVSSCPSCGLSVELGWRLLSEDGTTTLKESSTTFTNMPDWQNAQIKRDLPVLNYENEGRYVLEWGVLSSSGTPQGDMNDYNDLARTTIVFDNSIDLVVDSMFPTHSSGSSNYYYGEDSVKVIVANIGNVTIANTTLDLYVFSMIMGVDASLTCSIEDLKPDQTQTCLFDVELMGSKIMNASLSTTFAEGIDERPADNYISEQADFQVSQINPNIDFELPENGYFVTTDTITMVAKTNPNAAGPLTYTWKKNNIFTFATGRTIEVNASIFALGDTPISVTVEDTTGERESVYTQITIYNNTILNAEPYVTGSATTTAPATLNFSMKMPEIGSRYVTPSGTKPLMILSLDVIPTSSETDTGMNWMDVELNLSQILPSNINYSTVQALHLQGDNSTRWTHFQSPATQSNSNDIITLGLPNASHILLAGVSPNADVSLGELTVKQLPAGMMRLEMQPSGDLDNPYVGGWSLYKVSGRESITIPFPDPQVEQSEFVWNAILENRLVTNLSMHTDSWDDPIPLETGDCLSYALIPFDREGTLDMSRIHVSKNSEGLAELLCGDAVAPITTIKNFRATWEFTNDTACYEMTFDWNSCYKVDLSWTWPEHEPEGNLTWNLYRIEQRPTAVDISFIEPIIESMEAEPGTKHSLTQNGWETNGVKPYRVYYYVLAPIDAVGNLQGAVEYPSPNVVRVELEEQWFDVNPQLIPEPEPEPEPPYGIEFLGKLDEQMQREEFKNAGMMLLIILVLNMLMIPIIIKRRSKLKRTIKRREKNIKTYDDDDFADFFD